MRHAVTLGLVFMQLTRTATTRIDSARWLPTRGQVHVRPVSAARATTMTWLAAARQDHFEGHTILRCIAVALISGAGLGAPALSHAEGCLKGAAVGAVAGHVAGHHAVLGAAAGCAIEHHREKKAAKKKAADEEAAQAQAGSAAASTPSK